jgi:hypothetical protein
MEVSIFAVFYKEKGGYLPNLFSFDFEEVIVKSTQNDDGY